MGRFLPYAIAFVVVLYALIDVLLTRGSDVRTLPRPVWAIVIVLLPVIGALGWFVLGRPRRAQDGGGGLPGRGRGPVAPDDDPAFLRELEAKAWSEQMRKRREKDGRPSGGAGEATPGSDRPEGTDDTGGESPRRGGSAVEGPAADGPAVDSGSPGPAD